MFSLWYVLGFLLLLAVAQKRGSVDLAKQDVFANVAGGILVEAVPRHQPRELGGLVTRHHHDHIEVISVAGLEEQGTVGYLLTAVLYARAARVTRRPRT